MLKTFGLLFLAAVLVTVSCFNFARISEPGVVSQETCADIPVADPRRETCVNPEDTEMWRGEPNGAGWVFLILGVGIGAWALYAAYQNRERRRQLATISSSTPRHR
jgi:hypothetical protein